MAELLEPTGLTQPARTAYPWDEWLDGRPRRLTMAYPEREGDFTCEPRTFRQYAYAMAKKRGRKVAIQIDGESVIIQAYEPDQRRPILPVYYAHAANGRRAKGAPALSTIDDAPAEERPGCTHCGAQLSSMSIALGECRSALDLAWRCTSGEPKPVRKRPGS